MQYFNDVPWTLMDTMGPPTAPQPQWAGRGLKHQVFAGSPVAHVIAPDNTHHQMINIYPEEKHLPVQHELARYIDETGYNPAVYRIPAHNAHYDNYGTASFENPDTRPGSSAQPLPSPAPPGTARAAMQSINPAAGPMFPDHPVRNPDEAHLPYGPQGAVFGFPAGQNVGYRPF